MISYVPEDTFHIKEKKEKKGFMRKSKGKIKPYIANLLSLPISPDLFTWQVCCVNIFRKKIQKYKNLHTSITADRHAKESVLFHEHLKHKSEC